MTTAEQGSELYTALIGKKRLDYYLKRFESFDDRGGGLIPSWNWAAFFFTSIWALYRKMYAVFFVVLGISFIVAIIDTTLSLGSLLNNLIYVVLMIGFGIYGNALYYRHTIRKIAKTRTTLLDAEKMLLYIQSKGGVHVWVIWVILIIPFGAGVLAGIFVPAYQDYTVRAQVSEGLNLGGGAKTAVTKYFQDRGVWPANNDQAGLDATPTNIKGKYVKSVTVTAGGVVTVVYGIDAHATLLATKTVTFTPANAGGSVTWTCASRDLPDKHLPAVCRYNYGRGGPQDDAEAAVWFLRKAAEQGDADAQYSLGFAYLRGKGVERNSAEAAHWWRTAAEQGDADAQYAYGYLYSRGEGVSLNLDDAVMWYQKAAAQGYSWAEYALGSHYVLGLGVERDRAEATKWFQLVAGEDDYAAVAESFARQAENGEDDAQFFLGMTYHHGHGVPQDDAKALEWFQKAADQGYVVAQLTLGQMN